MAVAENPTWEVDLLVDGPVTLRRPFRTTQQKGFRPKNPFYSNIEITGIPSGGLRATVTARASNERLAFEAAIFFFGRMLDVLAFEVNLPLFSSLTERDRSHNARFRQHVRRNIEHQEIKDAFQEADDLAMTQDPFLRSLGWYRKGLHTEDPFDKFLAFWIAIEIVAATYYQSESVPSVDQERGKKGSINQIWACFKALWGPCEQWPNILGDDKWIGENYEHRKNIAHGISPVSIETVESVIDKLDMIQRVAYSFLQGWRNKVLYADLVSARQRPSSSDEEVLPF